MSYITDANKFRDEFEKYQNVGSASDTTPAEEDKLTEQLDKLTVNSDQPKDADSTDKKSGESSTSEEGVKAENSTSKADSEAKQSEDSKKDEPKSAD